MSWIAELSHVRQVTRTAKSRRQSWFETPDFDLGEELKLHPLGAPFFIGRVRVAGEQLQATTAEIAVVDPAKLAELSRQLREQGRAVGAQLIEWHSGRGGV